MNIDKTDFVNLLAEAGSDITAPDESTFKGVCVLLQRPHQLPDVKLEPGDLIAYVDPANSFDLGTSFSFEGYSFKLVSQRKVKYIGNNPIYRLLGFRLFAPGMELQSAYRINICLPINLYSSYDITLSFASILLLSSYFTTLPQVSGIRAGADPTYRNIGVHWNAIDNDDLDHYKVHRSTSGSFTPTDANLAGIPKTNSFLDRDLRGQTTYYFKVCAVSKRGYSGEYSGEVSAKTPQ